MMTALEYEAEDDAPACLGTFFSAQVDQNRHRQPNTIRLDFAHAKDPQRSRYIGSLHILMLI